MSKKLFIILIISFSLQANAQLAGKSFVLSGHVTGMNGKYIFFSYRGLGLERIWDSTIIHNNSFQFRGIITEPAKALLTDLETNRISTIDPHVSTPLFIEPGRLNINLVRNHFREAVLTGSKTQSDFIQLQKMKEALNKVRQPLVILKDLLDYEFINKAAKGTDQKELSELIKRINILNTKIESRTETTIDKEFFKTHPNSYITAFEIIDNLRNFSLDEFKSYYSKMSTWLHNTYYGKQLKSTIDKLSKGSPGSMASDFGGRDISGDSIHLSDFRGKYVLLDFWGSWCKPCRAGNPELVQLYLKYHSRGVEFLGIASDNKTQDKWREAVALDGIGIWKQILEGDIGNLYHIQSYPLKILIDPQGEIVGRYGEWGEPPEKLEGRLKKIFGN